MVLDVKKLLFAAVSVAAAAYLIFPASYSIAGSGENRIADTSGKDKGAETFSAARREKNVQGAVNFELALDSYQPKKDHYNFYFTYKIVHPWWDAVALGMEDAQRQYLKKGVIVTYEYMAPMQLPPLTRRRGCFRRSRAAMTSSAWTSRMKQSSLR